MPNSRNATFNIGGETIQISLDVLNLFPETILYSSALEANEEGDEETEIFIDRDCTLFRLILDYMCDGKVLLPPMVSKEDVLAELSYYGFEDVDESSIERSSCDCNEILRVDDVLEGFQTRKKCISFLQALLQEYKRSNGGTNILELRSSDMPDAPFSDTEMDFCNQSLMHLGLEISLVLPETINFTFTSPSTLGRRVRAIKYCTVHLTPFEEMANVSL